MEKLPPQHKQFTLREVQTGLGVAPATAERISGLLNGRVNPDNFRSLCQDDPLSTFGVVRQDDKIMRALATILEGEVAILDAQKAIIYIDLGDEDLPTVIKAYREFLLISLNEFIEEYFNPIRI